MNKPDIRPDHLKMVQDILNKSLSSDVKVWVYGSRAKWTTLDSSDLDLALEGKDKIDYEVINCLNRDFEESNLPYEVDVVDINTVQPFFRDIINKDKVLLDRYTLVKEKKTSPKGWKEVRLGDLCADISYGYTASAKHDPVGPKFLRITDIISDQINWSNVPYCEINEDKKKNYQLETGDIVIARTGANTGYNKIIKTNHTAIFASYLIRYKINHSLAYPFYINYVLKSLYWKNFVKSIVSGSAQPGANAKQFASFTFLLPSLSEQKAIAEILSSLDNKIEQNQNMNKILEDMAQSIFKSWFIDFDPVHAKKMALDAGLAEGQAERAAMAVIAGVCSPKQFAENFRQMDRSLGEKFSKINESAKYELIYKASLFPSEFVDSKLGLIPKGWSCKTINEIAAVIEGGTPSTKNKKYYCNKGKGTPWLTPKDISRYSWKYISNGAIDITNSGLRNSDAKTVPKGTVLISSRDPIGYIAIAENDLSMNQNFKCLVPVHNTDTQFLYYWAKNNISTMEAVATTGKTFKKITRRSMESLKLIVPNRDIMSQFNRLIAFRSRKQKIMRYENLTLEKTRDTLLPKLLSGEIDISKIKTKENL